MIENLDNSLIQLRGNLLFSLDHFIKAIDRCTTILQNLLKFPDEPKYKKIKVKEMLTDWYGIIDVLLTAGFQCILETGYPFLAIDNLDKEKMETVIKQLNDLRANPVPLDKDFVNIKITQLDQVPILCIFHSEHTLLDVYTYLTFRRTDIPFLDLRFYLMGPKSDKYYFTDFEIGRTLTSCNISKYDNLAIHQYIDVETKVEVEPESLPEREKRHQKYVDMRQRKLNEQESRSTILDRFNEDRENVNNTFKRRVKTSVETDLKVSDTWQKNLESKSGLENTLVPPINQRNPHYDPNHIFNNNNNNNNGGMEEVDSADEGGDHGDNEAGHDDDEILEVLDDTTKDPNIVQKE